MSYKTRPETDEEKRRRKEGKKLSEVVSALKKFEKKGGKNKDFLSELILDAITKGCPKNSKIKNILLEHLSPLETASLIFFEKIKTTHQKLEAICIQEYDE